MFSNFTTFPPASTPTYLQPTFTSTQHTSTPLPAHTPTSQVVRITRTCTYRTGAPTCTCSCKHPHAGRANSLNATYMNVEGREYRIEISVYTWISCYTFRMVATHTKAIMEESADAGWERCWQEGPSQTKTARQLPLQSSVLHSPPAQHCQPRSSQEEGKGYRTTRLWHWQVSWG